MHCRVFKHDKDARKRADIEELVDGDGSLKNQESINEYVQRFYKALYSNDLGVEENEVGRRECLDSVPRLVTQAQNLLLSRDFESIEIENAVKDLPTKEVRGHDGIPMEWYKEQWGSIKEEVT